MSWTAATFLAGDPPWDLQLEVVTRVHIFRARERSRVEQALVSRFIARIRRKAGEVLIWRWREDLGLSVCPHLKSWLKRGFNPDVQAGASVDEEWLL